MGRCSHILRRFYASILIVIYPKNVLPFPLAAEAYHDENTFLIAEIINLAALSPKTLHPDCVQVHVHCVVDLRFQVLLRLIQKNLVGPSAAPYEDLFPVQFVSAEPLRIDIVVDLSDAELDILGICNVPVLFKFKMERIEIRFSKVLSPP